MVIKESYSKAVSLAQRIIDDYLIEVRKKCETDEYIGTPYREFLCDSLYEIHNITVDKIELDVPFGLETKSFIYLTCTYVEFDPDFYTFNYLFIKPLLEKYFGIEFGIRSEIKPSIESN